MADKEKKPDSKKEGDAVKPAPTEPPKKEEATPVAPKTEPKAEEAKTEEKKEETETKAEEKKPETVEPKTEEKEVEKKEEQETEEKKEEKGVEGGEAAGGEEAGKTEVEEPKKKKGFRLPFFGKKNEEVDSEKSEETEDDKDDGQKENAKTEDEALLAIEKVEDELAEKIADDIETASDVFVFKISKSRLMLVLGVLVVMMWMIPAVKGIQMIAEKAGFGFSGQQTKPEAKVEEDVVKIRIRHSPDQDAVSDELSQLLKDGGYDFIEIEEDGEAEFEGVAVVTKNTDIETRIKIEGLLVQKYKVASPSAELTDDSDFDAVIIIGKQETAK